LNIRVKSSGFFNEDFLGGKLFFGNAKEGKMFVYEKYS